MQKPRKPARPNMTGEAAKESCQVDDRAGGVQGPTGRALLLDSCVWGGAKVDLEARGYDVLWCGDWPSDPGDEAVLKVAREQGRILVTLDKDFGELAVVKGALHCGIVRLAGFRAREQATACARVLEVHGAELQAGAIATAKPGQLRLRAIT